MRWNLLKKIALLTACCLGGCQSPQRLASRSKPAESAVVSGGKSFDVAIRNNALALLDDLLNDEKNLSKILIIKRESAELNRLVKSISNTARDGAKALEAMAKKDSHLPISTMSLPPGENATRKAIAKTKEHQLLDSKGAEFEFQLLLTQAEALNYGAHLARVASENEPQPDRAREFLNLSSQFTDLYDQVLAMLRRSHESPEKS